MFAARVQPQRAGVCRSFLMMPFSFTGVVQDPCKVCERLEEAEAEDCSVTTSMVAIFLPGAQPLRRRFGLLLMMAGNPSLPADRLSGAERVADFARRLDSLPGFCRCTERVIPATADSRYRNTRQLQHQSIIGCKRLAIVFEIL